MLDICFGVGFAFFGALSWTLLICCDRLMGGEHERS